MLNCGADKASTALVLTQPVCCMEQLRYLRAKVTAEMVMGKFAGSYLLLTL